MRTSRPLRFVLSAAAVPALFALAGCPREVDPLPDVFIPPYDGGPADAAIDGGPRVELCGSPEVDLGEACTDNADCNDHCFCNGTEECRGGTCQAGTGPCREDSVECTTISCVEADDRCMTALDHSLCTDGNACNGTEACHATRGCEVAPAPVCNDESSCTIDSCDPATGCVYTPRDLDGDGFIASTCAGGTDCDDDPRYGSMVYPGATEICDNRRDDDCDGARDYNDSDCVPTNDTCDVATVLDLGAMGGTFSGATTGLRNNYTLRCGSGTAPDAVFRFTLTEPRDVRISATAASASISLRTFDRCAAGPDDRCNNGSPPTVVRRGLPAGDYAIIVATPTAQPFDLSVRLTDPTTAPLTDICDATTTTVPITGGTFTGRFEDVEDDYTLSCSGTSRRDAVYAIDIPAGQLKNLAVNYTVTGGSFPSTFLSLTTDCGVRAGELQCSSYTSSLTRRELSPGRYYVVLEASGEPTDYSVTITLTDPPPRTPGDACSAPLDLTPTSIPGTRTQTIPVAGLEAALDAPLSCGSGTGRDGVFTFTLAAPQDVTLAVSGPGTLYGALRTSCGLPASETGCWSSSTGTLTRNFRALPAGTYSFVIQTTSSTGTFTGNIDVRAPTAIPTNDRCPGIDLGAGATRTDTTIAFGNDVNLPTCSGGTSGHSDAFYSFTLTERRRVIISATRGSGGVIYTALLATCAATTATACGASSGTTSTLATTLDAGTYYVVVETPAAAESDFTLDFVTLPPT